MVWLFGYLKRRLGIPINTNSYKDKCYKTLHTWCLRFLARYSFSIRNVTHVGQKLKINAKQQYYDFYKMLYNLRYQIGDYENYQNLFNMGETPIWFEMASVEKIGEKTVNVTTFGSERSRISLIL